MNGVRERKKEAEQRQGLQPLTRTLRERWKDDDDVIKPETELNTQSGCICQSDTCYSGDVFGVPPIS